MEMEACNGTRSPHGSAACMGEAIGHEMTIPKENSFSKRVGNAAIRCREAPRIRRSGSQGGCAPDEAAEVGGQGATTGVPPESSGGKAMKTGMALARAKLVES